MFFKTSVIVLLMMQWGFQDFTAQAQDIDSKLNELSSDIKQLANKFENNAKITEDTMQELRGEENFMLSILAGQQRALENKMDVVKNSADNWNQALSQLRQISNEIKQDLSKNKLTQDEIKQGQSQMKLTLDEIKQGQSQMKMTQDEIKQGQSQMKLTLEEVMEGQTHIKQALSQISKNQNADHTKIDSIINAIKKLPFEVPLAGLNTQFINGKRYFMSHNEPWMSWAEAENFCKSHGMDLVTIETQQEWDVLKPEVVKLANKIGSFPYCSGSDAAQEGKWKWTATGSDVTFFAKLYGKDNDPDENCLYISTDYWGDRPCLGKRFFICEQNQLC